MRPLAKLPLAFTLVGAFGAHLLSADRTAVASKTFHLGTKGAPEWNEFSSSTPHGRNLSLRFEGKRNLGEATLFLKQDDVKQGWRVSLN